MQILKDSIKFFHYSKYNKKFFEDAHFVQSIFILMINYKHTAKLLKLKSFTLKSNM